MATFDQYLHDRNDDGFIDDASARILIDPSDDIDVREFWSVLLDAAALIGMGAQALPLPLFFAMDPGDAFEFVRIRSTADARALSGSEAAEGDVIEDEDGDSSDWSPDLLDLFTTSGFLQDRDGDLVPDASRIGIVLPDQMSLSLGVALCNLAVRVGLESGGVLLPLVSDRKPSLRIEVIDEPARLTGDESGWALRGGVTDLPQLIEQIAETWPHFGHPETAGARAGVEWLADALAGDSAPAIKDLPVRWELEWADEPEVARLTEAIERRVMLRITPDSALDLVAFACEPPEIRRRLERALRSRAEALGARSPRVKVLSAFKVGLSWLTEIVFPELADREVERLEIYVRRFEPADGREHLDMSIRWLQELFPGDEFAAQRLDIPLDRIVMLEDRDQDAPVYRAVALDRDGAELGSWELDLLSYSMPFMPQVQGSELVEVTTGGFIATLDGERITHNVDTDLDRFWRFWQHQVLARLVREIEEDGGFAADRQPFFGALEVEVWLSSPNSRLGVREENDSAAEALHEDIYFNTLDTIEVLGFNSTGDRTSAPGAVIPIVHVQDGVAPHAVVRLRDAPPRRPKAPDLHVAALALDGGELVARVASGEASSLDAGEIVGSQANRSYRAVIQTENGPVELRLPLPEVLAGDGTDDAPPMDVNLHGSAVETWSGRVAEGEGVSAWVEGRSYQGRPISAVSVHPEVPGRIWSPAKLAALKPTALVVARHHANEISSTNAALRLAYLCRTDAEWIDLARKLNIVIIPYENADGAALHARLAAAEAAATWKHHPARYNALGHEFGEDFHRRDTPYGEARVRPALWRRWLPDAIVDNHGVPSHEWVQPFAGFGSPPRFRVSYWIPQALIYGIVRYVEDDEYPEHETAALRLRDAVAAAFVDTAIGDLNRGIGASYRRWGQDRVPERFPGTFHNDMLWHFGGTDVDPAGRGFNVRYPRTTVLSWVTEVNDETATGDHLEMVATAHLEANRAMFDVLAELDSGPKRSVVRLADGGMVQRFARERPLGRS